ncbi:hypothetical protein [Qipengyuania sp. MTN3-11]|uniref:hypothetical protein n=1 Tax=Qipengyuania sp. MTN3-11 TaxID=3056557 RepID=UPI0036F39145
MSKDPHIAGVLAIGLLSLCSAPASADETVDSISRVAVGEPITPDFSTPRPLTLEELSAERGGTAIVLNNQTLGAITAGNSIGSYLAGTINLSDNALSSFNGVGNFLFNTGAQNNLQAGMTLTITLEN